MLVMKKLWSNNLWAIFLFTLCASTSLAVALSQEDGNRLQAKIDAIVKNGAANSPKPREFSMAEQEVNSYLLFNLKEKI